MPYNESIAHRIRKAILPYQPEISEKKMFGGLSFLYKGKMAVGVVKDELAVRVAPTKVQAELAKENVRPMDFTKKPMKEFVFVSIDESDDLSHWIELGIEHAKSKLK